MGPIEVGLILFGIFAALVILRVPVAFALGLACVPVFFIDDRLTPFLLLNEMLKSYNSFLLLAIPFFMLAANLMNTAGITEKLIKLSRALVGHLPGGLGHVSVLVSMLFAGISGSSTAEAAGVGGVLIPGASAPKLVSAALIKKMTKGSVIVDVAIGQGGCFETSHPTTHADPTYIVDGVIHYCVATMPGGVPRTSTFAPHNATLPLVLSLADKVGTRALHDDAALTSGSKPASRRTMSSCRRATFS